MVLGRPVNLWVGLIGAVIGTCTTIIAATQPPDVAQQWAIILGSIGGLLGIVVAFIAGQPPTLAPGDPYTLRTPGSQPNETHIAGAVITYSPQPDEPPVLPDAETTS